MHTITIPTHDIIYPDRTDVLIVPTGYPDSPLSFDTSVMDVLNYLKEAKLDIDIDSSPDTFSTYELNSNLKRLGKFVVKDIVLPTFIGLMTSYISEICKPSQSVDDQPVKVKLAIEVCDSSAMKVTKTITFEGSADDFNEIASNIDSLLKSAN